MKLRIFFLTIIFFISTIFYPKISKDDTITNKPHLIIILSSYNIKQVCGRLQLDGILSTLKNYHGTIITFYFKSKTYNITEYQRNYAADEIYLDIKNLEQKYYIDAIFVTDDNAFKYIVICKILHDKNLQNKLILVSGLNYSIKKYIKNYPFLEVYINKNLYLIQEKINFLKLLNFISCNEFNKPIYFLYDNTKTSRYVFSDFKKIAKNFYFYKIYYINITSIQQLQKFLNNIPKNSIIISNLFVLKNNKNLKTLQYINILKILHTYINKYFIISFNPLGKRYINMIISPGFYKMGQILGSIFWDYKNIKDHIIFNIKNIIYLNINSNQFLNSQCVNKYVDVLVQ